MLGSRSGIDGSKRIRSGRPSRCPLDRQAACARRSLSVVVAQIVRSEARTSRTGVGKQSVGSVPSSFGFRLDIRRQTPVVEATKRPVARATERIVNEGWPAYGTI